MVKRLGLICLLALVFLMPIPAFAHADGVLQGYPSVNVVVDGQPLQSELPAIVIDGQTLAPLRTLCEALGVEVRWDASTDTVYISSPAASNPLPAPDENVIRIGLIAPLGGDLNNFGVSMQNGFNMAIEDGHDLAGFKLEAVTVDDRNDPTEAVGMAAKLITQDRVSGIVGPLTSKSAVPVTDFAENHKVPVITPTATNPNVTVTAGGLRKAYAFRASVVDPFQGTMAAKFALENLQIKTAAILYDLGNPYSEGLAREFEEAFRKGGGKVVACDAYSQRDIDFAPFLVEIAAQKPDILYIPDYYHKASQIGKQARERGIEAIFLGGDGWDCPDIDWQAMDGGYFTTHWSPDDPRPEVREWISDYQERYGTLPDVFATLAYDSTKILLRAVEAANSGDPVKVKEEMQAMNDFPAVTGEISFDDEGNPVKPVVVMQIKDGQQVYFTTVNP